MITVDLTNPIFTDLDKAREHYVAIRWPNGPYCSLQDRVVYGAPYPRGGR
jgi:hypothetical protein